jgi:hypothetical protein
LSGMCSGWTASASRIEFQLISNNHRLFPLWHASRPKAEIFIIVEQYR